MSERLKRCERKEVHQITRAWVDQHCRHRVTERDLELCRALLKRRLLRRDQIADLVHGFRGLANPEKQINRRLRVLFDCHVIDRAFPSVPPGYGSAQAVVALDRAGAILLNTTFRSVIQHTRDRFGGRHRSLPPDYVHTLGIHDFEVQLHQWCDDQGAELLRWRIDFENMRRFHFNVGRVIRPDGFAIVRTASGKGMAFYFEYDTGTEDIRARRRFRKLEEKFKNYLAFKASGIWAEEDWAKKLREFPAILFLTEDERRVGHLREMAARLANLRLIVGHTSCGREALNSLFDDAKKDP